MGLGPPPPVKTPPRLPVMSKFPLVLKNPVPVDAAAMWPAREKRVHVPYECGLCPPACSPARPPCCSPPRPPVPPVKILRTLFDRCRKVLVRPCAPDSNSGFSLHQNSPIPKNTPPGLPIKNASLQSVCPRGQIPPLAITFDAKPKKPFW